VINNPQKSPLDSVKKIPKRIKYEYHKLLLKWFQNNSRNFPWRHTSNPYHLLISEILLQKTNSRVVGEVYEDFLQRYPSLEDVTKYPLKEIQRVIAPLGLVYRAERLQRICRAIVHDYGGNIPDEISKLLELKGVGRYVASAILLFGYGKPLGLVDANVIRVLSRVFSILSQKSRPQTDPEFWKAAEALVPKRVAREYNLALLDFSALVCHIKPKCEICPLKTLCQYYSKNYAENQIG
jgi:A/G-specific adenine glycosylase